NKDRFITKPESGLDQERLKQKKTYLGLQAQAVLDTRNNQTAPTRGVHWINTARWINGVSRISNSFTQWESTFSYFVNLMAPNQVVLAGRIGGGANYGNYEFFQAQYLGGNESLRGYRNFRFAGDKRFYNNLDLRIKLTELRGYILPGTLGLLFFQDLGRVWLKNESSRSWHLGYGGGIWLAPANRFVLAACYGQSEEGGLPFVSLGFQF
ncbi:MAG: BamA/TamA family outer membrane protein, partial [Sediminibacterium sp.]